MKRSNVNILLIVSSVLALGGIGYYIFKKYQQKRDAEIYKKAMDEMANKYGAELFN